MNDDSLTQMLNAWTCRAVASSFYLVGLYRRLEDEMQASRALRAGQAALERVQNLGLGGAVQVRLYQLRNLPSEEEAEQTAWQAMVGSLGGVTAFYTMAESRRKDRSSKGLRGPMNAFRKGLAQAIRGFHTAFPKEMADRDIETAFDEISVAVADALIQTAGEQVAETDRAELQAFVRQLFAEENPKT